MSCPAVIATPPVAVQVVAEFKRTVLIPKRPNGASPKAEGDVE